MLLKEYLEALNKLVKKDKSLLDLEIITADDDEGNGYKFLNYTPDVRYIEKDSGYYIDGVYESCDIEDDEGYDMSDFKRVVLMN